MKSLSLFRHGKSSWKYATDDLYRPLNRRGLSQTTAMAQQCTLDVPDVVLCSPASRAYATALIYLHELDISVSKMKLERQLYEASAVQLLLFLESLPDSYNKVWVFSHNPGLQDLAQQLVVPFSAPFVTAAYLSLEIDTTSWATLKTSRISLNSFKSPQLDVGF